MWLEKCASQDDVDGDDGMHSSGIFFAGLPLGV
jgi:hypothetical protein